MPSGRPKGGNNKIWTKEEKEKIVLYHINNEIGMDKCADKFGISRGQMFQWVTIYREKGIHINEIIYDHNYLRPSYALNYKTPIEYRTQSGFQ